MIAGVAAGLTQFFLPTHLLAVIALGLLFGQSVRAVPVHLALFVLGLIVGSVVIASAIRDPPAAPALLAIAAVAGFIIVLARAPLYVTGPLVFVTGGALALNAPPQALTISGAIGEQTGTAIAALVTLTLVAFIAAKAERSWQRIGVRVVGSWIAASAILVLALRLAR